MSLLRRVTRNPFTVFKRNIGDPCYNPGPGWVGSNLPFQIDNLPRLMIVACLYGATGMGLPFFALRYMILKK